MCVRVRVQDLGEQVGVCCDTAVEGRCPGKSQAATFDDLSSYSLVTISTPARSVFQSELVPLMNT